MSPFTENNRQFLNPWSEVSLAHDPLLIGGLTPTIEDFGTGEYVKYLMMYIYQISCCGELWMLLLLLRRLLRQLLLLFRPTDS
jgi:hypothetical protein